MVIVPNMILLFFGRLIKQYVKDGTAQMLRVRGVNYTLCEFLVDDGTTRKFYTLMELAQASSINQLWYAVCEDGKFLVTKMYGHKTSVIFERGE